MEDIDTVQPLDSPHHIDYDDLVEHVIQGDHELLYLDAYLRDAFTEGEIY